MKYVAKILNFEFLTAINHFVEDERWKACFFSVCLFPERTSIGFCFQFHLDNRIPENSKYSNTTTTCKCKQTKQRKKNFKVVYEW